MNKNEFCLILKLSLVVMGGGLLYSLSKFNFDLSKINIFKVLDLFPFIFFAIMFCFYLNKMMKDK
ncbi:hypothetical protein BKK54_11245 [Rodentibacter genomosp. 1]|uniref:Uncharacterized protein n=1 Tax=Rodentibacter genomosp. 1 TaxID=1908264 RepID=A0A1V3IZY4_9PAST|nr:hypothetical protein [Rodentibacter genomosp. 1]OOF47996.1 hypothetical protein BKK54_11245 [Rodentibacter genomosp. 1]